ncbi:MAG: transglutaminase-like domain-containing protein, partial [Bacteroidota bacterium]
MHFKIQILLIAALYLIGLNRSLMGQSVDEQMKLSDAPEQQDKKNAPSGIPYLEILESWDHVDSVNQWIDQYFGYDMSRAIKLGEGSAERSKTKILTPEEFYQNPSGVCLDLSRFAVESLRKISEDYKANYLMIEFEPLEIKGSIIRNHWIAVYMDDGLFNFVADSKFPGRKYEGYSDVASFINEYESLRGRKIVNYKIVPSYEKKKKMQ